MDKEKFLKSSLLEKYAMGTASDMERSMVDQALGLFPDLKEELAQLELVLEGAARDNAVTPPKSIKADILKRINDHDRNSTEKIVNQRPTQSQKSRMSWMSMAVSFCLGSMLAALIGWSSYRTLQYKLLTTQEELAVIKENCNGQNQLFAFISDPSTTKVLLNNEKGHQSVGYWNDQMKNAHFQALSLPRISSDESYQIWADVDGVMLSVGVLDAVTYEHGDYIELAYLENAESLNVTIEPKGGSEHPNVDRLVFSASI